MKLHHSKLYPGLTTCQDDDPNLIRGWHVNSWWSHVHHEVMGPWLYSIGHWGMFSL